VQLTLKSEEPENLRHTEHGATVRPEDLAYAAGFFDGEGCINITRFRWHCTETKRPGVYYKLRVMVTNTDLPVLEWCQRLWGGAILERKVKGNRRRSWSWDLYETDSARFLKDVLPYLKLKRPQADLALEYTRTNRRFGRNTRPPEYMAQRERFYQQMKAMKLPA